MIEARFRRPEALISTEDLQARLGDPDLRVFDCTTHLLPDPEGRGPYVVGSGAEDHAAGHIPGAVHLELQRDFSRKDSPFRFTIPDPETLAAAFGRAGIGDGTQVVLYSRSGMPWATRFWWMLRYVGFDGAAVLDGGFAKWEAEGRPVETGPVSPCPPATLTPRPRPEVFVGRDAVKAGIEDAGVCTVNALMPDNHSGENARYGRAGRVPGAINLPAPSLWNAETGALKPAAEIAAAFEAAGADPAKRVIAYCGGGIFATLDAFVMHQLGFEDVAVYDNSLSEWANDPDLPMEVG